MVWVIVSVTFNTVKFMELKTEKSNALVHPVDTVVMVTLDERMKKAGMLSIEQMLEKSPLGAFSAHAGVTDLEKFEDWIQMRRKGFLTMQARMTLDKQEDDEMFEWVLSHCAVLGEVISNFRQATGRRP